MKTPLNTVEPTPTVCHVFVYSVDSWSSTVSSIIHFYVRYVIYCSTTVIQDHCNHSVLFCPDLQLSLLSHHLLLVKIQETIIMYVLDVSVCKFVNSLLLLLLGAVSRNLCSYMYVHVVPNLFLFFSHRMAFLGKIRTKLVVLFAPKNLTASSWWTWKKLLSCT